MTVPTPDITPTLVRRLIAGQFPQWANLPVTPVAWGGWDNRTFHLGSELLVRLPSAEGYAPQVSKEHRWLPVLASLLPLPIPEPIALGVPAEGYPWPWSVYGWLEEESALQRPPSDLTAFAMALAKFLVALQSIDASAGPPPGVHSAFRGGPLTTYDRGTRQAIADLGSDIDAQAALEVWEMALSASWHSPPVWFHGDVAAGNLLVQGGRLSAVIDFGCAGVGDPACDLSIAWTLFEGQSRQAFRAGLPLDGATWARGRGWALWKALITLAEYRFSDEVKAAEVRRVLDEVLMEKN
ncbi:aminoglycoside phosphotransferase family protein [Deinococcus sp. Arct2-2]|uniref:aminoglycoside phosphotransferase family protein n=1 Tax=Deinococcus sp. Arct2-2 TaxID=2568653 RepID=UPI0010A4CDD7|nr:aminoglycoside phosphotransferase family protein [Deinococcus sp. Arct2-2]THF71350.1 aminoglycoside phosphotransferase family protein [Deinococcus sp. Arct2-2]